MGNWLSTRSATDNTEEKVLNDGEKMMLSNNRVVVYVWTSPCLGGRGSGHVSVEITRDNENGTLEEYTYISFWPKLELNRTKWPENKACPEFYTDGERWSYIHDYTGDRLFQNRRPELICCFYKLDTSDIITAFKMFKANEKNAWTRHGQYVPKISSGNLDYATQLEIETKQSCVSLACLTLDAGKINQYMDLKDVVWASSVGTTGVSSENSEEAYRNLNFIQPSKNIAEYVKRQIVSGFIMSPDVLVERLKIAKTKEWDLNPDVRAMGRMTCTTVVNNKGSLRTITFSSQPITNPIDLQPRQSEGNVLDETTFEWLPCDNID